MAVAIEPFAGEGASVEVGGPTVESRADRVTLYGSVDPTRDREGLARARAPRRLLGRVARALEAEERLPARLPPPEGAGEVANPFA